MIFFFCNRQAVAEAKQFLVLVSNLVHRVNVVVLIVVYCGPALFVPTRLLELH